MRLVSSFIVLAWAVSFASPAGGPEWTMLHVKTVQNSAGTVHIVLMDGLGRGLGEGTVASFKNEETGRDFAKTFHENNSSMIPYGSYELEVHKVGWFSTKREVDLFAPEVWVVVGLRVGEELPVFPAPRTQFQGTIQAR